MSSLDSLPVDVQYNILSWLICPLVGHPIARSPQSQEELYSAELYKLVAPRYASSNKFTGNHPYLCLAASSRTLRATLEDYCHHLVMKRLATCIKAKRIITPKYKDWSADVAKAATNGNEVPVGNTRTYRLQYLKWAYENCLFCGKKSSRRAIFNLHMWCCKHCDKAQWGEKVSKSEAQSRYKLKELHFQYPHLLWPNDYSEPLDFALANLPVYRGAMMLKVSDLEKLDACRKQNTPSPRQMRELKARANERTITLQKLDGLESDRKAIARIKDCIDTWSSQKADLVLVYTDGYRLGSTLSGCSNFLRRNLHHVEHPDLVAYKRCMAWWNHFATPWVEKNFKVEEGMDEFGRWTHVMKARCQQPLSSVLTPDENGEYWVIIVNWIPRSPPAESVFTGTSRHSPIEVD